jgi:peptidoglycan/LPS O-acetylase OafA/YrhL
MTVPRTEPERRQWADLAIIIVGLMLLGMAIWGGPVLTDAGEEIAFAQAVWLVYAGAGALCLGAVLAAQRWSLRGLARILVLVAAIGLLASLFAYREFRLRAVLVHVLPAIVLAVASRNIGPVPPPT